MTLTKSIRRKASAGFSLLEMIVALSILALALGALYQATGGATRTIRADEKYAYGVELARSLLADNGRVPATGKAVSGETSGGFRWTVKTSPVNSSRTSLPDALLHEIEVGVNWTDGGRRREVVLNSVVEGYRQ
jgi:general secretion pathway protein I